MRAVFLDKDGTLVQDVPYNIDLNRIQLQPGAAEALRLLHAASYLLVVVSNQSGVARGYFTEEALWAVADHVHSAFADIGVPLVGFYYCPHHPEGAVPAYSVCCACRKPEPGLLLRAAAEHGIDLGQSWVVGDSPCDVTAGRRVGCRTVLVSGHNKPELSRGSEGEPHFHATDLLDAARLILSRQGIDVPGTIPMSP